MADSSLLVEWLQPLVYDLDLNFPSFTSMSTTPGSFPDDELPQETSEDATTPSPKFEFTWEDLRSCSRYIDSKGWSQAPIPTILDIFPENIVISPQLQQILLWSLQRFDDTTDVGSTTQKTQGSTDDILVVAHGDLPTRSNTVVAAKPHDDEIQITPSRAKTQRSLPLIARLKQLRQDVASKVASSTSPPSPAIKDAQSSLTKPVVEVANTRGECISCFDEFPKWDLVHLKCSHDYCKPCLREVVFTAMKNEAAFPPKCCLTEIPLKTVLVSLEQKQRDEYRDKSAEYAIPAGHRWYCPEPKCGKWIKPENLHKNRRSQQTCPHCKTSICSMCRSLAHDTNQDCPQDFGLESTLEIAESQGWRRCYSCRTMVELTTGCRHITCRCGAQFCYVCNAVWRTCNCTEADKERRIRELRAQQEQRTEMEEEERRRREEEDEAARVEAEEMAEAIRQVEEMERQDAIRRVEEERQRQLEEELMLAQLEEARLLEEIARRDAEELAERQFREILITSSKEECQAMMKMLMQIINHQHTALMSSHRTQEQNAIEEKEFRQAQKSSKWDTMLSWLQDNVNKRTLNLTIKQQTEWEALLLQAENEEDEMFMHMHIYLRDKTNREQREKKMRDAFQKQQQEKTDRLQQRHVAERRRLEIGVGYEFEGLRKATGVQTEPLQQENDTVLETLGGLVGGDRQWFQLISTRRINMLNEHKKIVLQQLEAEEEPTGLTIDQARLVAPILPTSTDDEIAWSDIKSTAVGATASLQIETSDLYGASSEIPPSTPIQRKPVPDTPYRSDTVVRSVPGAFPTILPSPTSAQPQSLGQDSIMDRPRPLPSTSSQQATKMTSAFPTTISTPKPNQNQTTNEPTSSTIGNSLPLPNQSKISLSTLSTYDFTANNSTATLSTTTTPSSKHSSTQSHSSASTNTETSVLDTIPADIIARHSQSHEKKSSFGAMFRGFGKKKEFSEDEIRWRMSTRATVGDGWGM